MIDPDVCARWRLVPGPVLGDRPSGTWAATRGDAAFVVKHLDPVTFPGWRYTLRVAAALRARGWPTPEPAEEPLTGAGGTWVLFRRLPGSPTGPGDRGRPAEQRARGRLLAELHADALATGITDQRDGFRSPADVVADPELDRWLRAHEAVRPDEGTVLRSVRETTAQWFADHADPAAPRSVIHGDFTPWNLLYDDGRLTGVVDFEATHHTFQVADFALSWRGYQDDVLRGYDEVRALSDLEWHLVRPTFRAWLFLGVRDVLARYYGRPGRPCGPAPDLRWQLAHLGRQSALLTRKAGPADPG
ncbi:phosphotransferase enzyme family protein [Jidongwangia harbinensis]|uniref:phosphotransferase enzyme family protein n=1 Tax=Jidongwangia harbinensis TaxID=2878561 RepID=UPI001CDA19E9|nr:phosphotransferase [Jidongwangia harbinensis]MCA2212145.1 phosphotransferase [Jidongwangia harbinensis]